MDEILDRALDFLLTDCSLRLVARKYKKLIFQHHNFLFYLHFSMNLMITNNKTLQLGEYNIS